MNESTGAGRPQSLNPARLIAGLERLSEREDRAALAALRRGLGKEPGEAPEMFPVLVPLLAGERLWPWHERAAYMVASLYATHPAGWSGEGDGRWDRNLGASLRRLDRERDSAGIERRLASMLNADSDDLGDHLRRAVALLRTSEIPIDWRRLSADLLAWGRPDREVQRRWATSFWGDRETDEG